MKKRKKIFICAAGIFFAAVFFVYLLCYSGFFYREQVLLPTDDYEVFPLTDSALGGFSTSELRRREQMVIANINVRSGLAYSYAGVGVNLLSVRNKPASDFFDFSQYDSIAIDVASERLRTVEIRILNHDPVYSTRGDYLSYRPQVKTVNANGITKIALKDFENAKWWLAAQGLDKDDYLAYFERGVLVAVVNGEGALRGIPDEIRIKSLKLWSGHN